MPPTHGQITGAERSTPTFIVREEYVETARRRWFEPGALHRQSRSTQLLTWGFIVSVFILYFITAWVLHVTVLGYVLLIVGVFLAFQVVTKWEIHRDFVWPLRPGFTRFLEFDQDGLCMGVRGAFDSWFAWRFCRMQVYRKEWRLLVHGRMIPINPQWYSPQEIAQIRYWASRAHDRTDRCHHCGYDLTGTAGPLCPECGGAVRVKRNEPRPAESDKGERHA